MSTQQPIADPRGAGLARAAIAHFESAKTLLQQRRLDAAEHALRAALSASPDHPELLRLLGLTLRLVGRNADALTHLRRAAAQRPDDPLIQNGLATALDACGEHDAALDAFRRACELAPGSAELWANFGKALVDRGRFEEAIEPLQRATAVVANDAAEMRLANALRVVGRANESAQHYRAIVARKPAHAEAWLGLSNLQTRNFSAQDIDALHAAWQRNETSVDDRISLGFALSRALEDGARYAESFDVLTRANALTRSIRPWDRRDFSSHVDRVLAAFENVAGGSAHPRECRVIFIVSMPRAGSTLVEQILASHPQVIGAGELMTLSDVLQDESRRHAKPFPHWVASTDAAEWSRLGADYLQRTQNWQTRSVFTDKMPDNWLRIGAALAMLPNARVIDVRREPVETCFSCFRTLFNQGSQAFTYDLDDVAAYYHDYRRATGRWSARYPANIRTQSYEALVADPRAEIAALLDFCGLPYDAACERFYETRRDVRTASSSQVREPMQRDTARAQKFGALLDPLRHALKFTQ